MSRWAQWADWAAPVVAFLLYTNAAVIAVQFHGVPFVIAASYPLLLLLPIGRDLVFRGEPLNASQAASSSFTTGPSPM